VKAILTWHSVDDSGSVISATADQLSSQLDTLAASGVEVVRLDEIASVPSHRNAVALTFDDGYANFASDALPILTARQVPVTVFITPGYVGKTNEWDAGSAIPTLELMNWDEVRALPESLVDIGGHGSTHVELKGLDTASLDREVADCATSITEEIMRAPRAFAFPYGAHDQTAMNAVARVFAFGCTTRFALLEESDLKYALPRLDMYYFRDPGELKHFGTSRFASYVAVRRAGRTIRGALNRNDRRET
jgi:peptidoglycan/xylan/chitin deacetylase (PgdA/CDA1 family)